jgi:SAM-dependent methyltransferase
VSIFGTVADLYDAARPGYPTQLFDALGTLEGRTVIDIGAGTGIATVELLARRAKVVAVDVSPEMLARAKARNSRLVAVVSDGAQLPLRDVSADCACFAQSWHWMEEGRRVQEVARILRAGGLWAAWWSQPRADGQVWFEHFWEIIESSCEGIHRQQRDADWGQELVDSGLFDMRPVAAEPWIRHIEVQAWLMDLRTQSFIAALDEERRAALLDEIAEVTDQGFPGGRMVIPYDTTLWSAIRK